MRGAERAAETREHLGESPLQPAPAASRGVVHPDRVGADGSPLNRDGEVAVRCVRQFRSRCGHRLGTGWLLADAVLGPPPE